MNSTHHPWITSLITGAVLALAGCAAGPNQQLGIAGGAVAGGVIGHALGGNRASTIGGAAVGGLIGNDIGRNADQSNYYNQQQQGYYPPPNQGYSPPNGGYYPGYAPGGYYPSNGPTN